MILGLALTLTGNLPAQAADQRGPAPTVQSIEAARGPFATSTSRVSSLVSGFGGGTISLPTDTSQGRVGGGAIAPGHTAGESSIAWLGPRLASQGFVVFTIDTLTRVDQPRGHGAVRRADELPVLTAPVEGACQTAHAAGAARYTRRR